jgi:hypothetical protein
MISEEMNRKVKFLIDYQAEFAIRQDRDHETLVRGFETLREYIAQFQVFTTELISMQADRLHRQGQLQEAALRETRDFQRQALHPLNLILDRLPPASANEAT